MADILVQKDANNLIPKLGISASERAAWAVDYTIYDINADGTKGAAYGPTSPPPADEALAPDSTQFRRDESTALKSLVSADGISGATYDGLGRLTGYTRQGVAHVVSYPSGTAVVISNTTGAEREVTLDGDGRVQAIA